MTEQLNTTPVVDNSIEEIEWLGKLHGKTIRGVRPTHENGPVPDVLIMFTDGTSLLLSVKEGVYFEGCLINTLRRAQPIVSVVSSIEDKEARLELRSRTFPLLQLRARKHGGVFPFVLSEAADA